MIDGAGVAEFATIFPGCYPGRTNHIHFKVRLDGAVGETYRGGHTAHIGQVFFPEDPALRVMASAPHASTGVRRTPRSEDGVFPRQHGTAAIAKLASGGSDLEATLVAAVSPNAARLHLRQVTSITERTIGTR